MGQGGLATLVFVKCLWENSFNYFVVISWTISQILNHHFWSEVVTRSIQSNTLHHYSGMSTPDKKDQPKFQNIQSTKSTEKTYSSWFQFDILHHVASS